MKGIPWLTVARNQDRFIRCASCRATAAFLLNRAADGRTLYSSCGRHVRGHVAKLRDETAVAAMGHGRPVNDKRVDAVTSTR